MIRRSYSPIFTTLMGLLLTLVAAPVLADDATTAKLETVKSDKFLSVPADVSGDFEVASTAPVVRFAVLPGQTEGANLWSSWGDAEFASTDDLYVSVGDHDMPTGRSLVYRVNPEDGQITTVIDVNAVTGVAAGQYAPGKIHAPLFEDKDGQIWAIGYRGSTRGHNDKVGFKGDPLLSYDPETGEAKFHSFAVPYSSVAAMTYHEASHSFYGLNSPGENNPDQEPRFFVYDIEADKLRFHGGPPTAMARALLMHPDGRAWYDIDGKLAMYDPEKNEVVETDVKMPEGGALRAATRFNSEGAAYGINRSGQVFRFTPDEGTGGKIETLGEAFTAGPLYTAACKLSPDERYLYYAPGAHGRTHQAGTPVIQFDTETGERKVLAFLHQALRDTKDYHLGGTYALEVSPDGSTLGIGWNGHQKDHPKPDFGLCSVMLLEIPASERGGE